MAPEYVPKTKSNLPTVAMLLLLVIVAVQNILAMLLAKQNTALAQAMFVTKEMYLACVIGIFGATVLITGRLNRELVIPLVMIAYLFAVGVFASPYFNLASLRQAVVIPVFVTFGWFFAGRADVGTLARWVFRIYLVIVCLGLFERLVLYTEDETFFLAVGVQEWAEIKGWGYEIPRSWYSADLLPWIGERVRRMPGLLIGDAVNFGQLLAFPMLMAVVFRKYLVAGVVALALVLGMSKGGILASIVGVSLYLAFERFGRRQRYMFLTALVVLGGVGIYLSLDIIRQIYSIMDHFRGGYLNSLNIFDSPFGGGVGAGGNFARRFAAVGASDAFGLSAGGNIPLEQLAYGESYLGTMLAQFGFPGLMLYVYYPIRLLRVKLARSQPFLHAVKYAALGFFAVGVFSETAFTYVGTGFVVALIPFVLGSQRR